MQAGVILSARRRNALLPPSEMKRQTADLRQKREKMANSTKKTNKRLLYLIIALVIAVVSGLSTYIFPEELLKGNSTVPELLNGQEEAEQLNVHYIDVGQGDCMLIEFGDETMLIDSGERGNEQTVINYIRNEGFDSLDYVVVSHQHTDHMGSMVEVLGTFEVGQIIMPRISKASTPTNSTYTKFLKAVADNGAKVVAASAGKTYPVGEAVVTILGPLNIVDDLNNMSVVMRLDYGETSFLFTGDAEKQEEEDIIKAGYDLDCDVLKVGHHGSKSSSSYAFLELVTPETAVITCGKYNDYGHPHDAALRRIKTYTEDIYRTDVCGSVVITSNGTDYTVNY